MRGYERGYTESAYPSAPLKGRKPQLVELKQAPRHPVIPCEKWQGEVEVRHLEPDGLDEIPKLSRPPVSGLQRGLSQAQREPGQERNWEWQTKSTDDRPMTLERKPPIWAEHEQIAARREHPADLAQRLYLVSDVLEYLIQEDAVE